MVLESSSPESPFRPRQNSSQISSSLSASSSDISSEASSAVHKRSTPKIATLIIAAVVVVLAIIGVTVYFVGIRKDVSALGLLMNETDQNSDNHWDSSFEVRNLGPSYATGDEGAQTERKLEIENAEEGTERPDELFGNTDFTEVDEETEAPPIAVTVGHESREDSEFYIRNYQDVFPYGLRIPTRSFNSSSLDTADRGTNKGQDRDHQPRKPGRPGRPWNRHGTFANKNRFATEIQATLNRAEPETELQADSPVTSKQQTTESAITAISYISNSELVSDDSIQTKNGLRPPRLEPFQETIDMEIKFKSEAQPTSDRRSSEPSFHRRGPQRHPLSFQRQQQQLAMRQLRSQNHN